MNAFLSHIDLGPLVYGVVMFIGLLIIVIKIRLGKWLDVGIDIGVFYLVFSLHGGSLAGGFSAMVAALLAGAVFPFIIRRK